MTQHRIASLETRDVRFPLVHGAGSGAVHSGAEYAFATTLLASDETSKQNQVTGSLVLMACGSPNDNLRTASGGFPRVPLDGGKARRASERDRFLTQATWGAHFLGPKKSLGLRLSHTHHSRHAPGSQNALASGEYTQGKEPRAPSAMRLNRTRCW